MEAQRAGLKSLSWELLGSHALARAVVEAIRDAVSPERAARALAELARGGAHHGLALEVLSGGPHWVRFATELAGVMGSPSGEPKSREAAAS